MAVDFVQLLLPRLLDLHWSFEVGLAGGRARAVGVRAWGAGHLGAPKAGQASDKADRDVHRDTRVQIQKFRLRLFKA